MRVEGRAQPESGAGLPALLLELLTAIQAVSSLPHPEPPAAFWVMGEQNREPVADSPAPGSGGLSTLLCKAWGPRFFTKPRARGEGSQCQDH